MNVPKLRFCEFSGEWEEKKLGKVAEINPSNRNLPEKFIYIDLESVINGNLLKENEILKEQAPSRAQRLLIQNDILFQMVRPYQMNNLFFDKNGIFVASTGYAQLRTIENSRFLYQYLHFQKFVDKVIERCTGTSYPAINSTDLSNILIKSPSEQEQEKIASFLTSVDTKIEQLTKKKTLLEQYKKGVMQKIFSQEIRFKNDDGSEYPEWVEKKLGEVAEIIMGQSPESNSYNLDEIGQPLIQGNADIQNRLSNPRNWTTQTTKECKIGDLILTVRAPVGAVAKSVHNACIGRGVCAIKNNSTSNIEFLFQFLLNFESKWGNLEQGSTFTAVSGNEIKKLKIHMPTLKEQTKIANFLSSLDSKLLHVEQQLNSTKQFKKALLQQMFV